jgi:predicted nucleic acid-binding protein
MSGATILADAGAIVGLIYGHDQWHSWASKAAADLSAPYFTCEPVITEVCFLLKNRPDGQQEVLKLIEEGVFVVDFSLPDNLKNIRALMKKYEDLPMSIADACLVRMSELISNSAVFTVDGDFRIYRRHGRREIPLVIPDQL